VKRGANGGSDVDVGSAAITVCAFVFVSHFALSLPECVCASLSLSLAQLLSLFPPLAGSLFSISIPISIQIAISFPSSRLRPQERVPFAKRSVLSRSEPDLASPFFTVFVLSLRLRLLLPLRLYCFCLLPLPVPFYFIIYSGDFLCVLFWLCVCAFVYASRFTI